MLDKRLTAIVIVLMILTLFAACTSGREPIAPERPTAAPVSLAGTEWILIQLNGRAPLSGTQITLTFDDENNIGGFAGCNYYGGPYHVEGDRMTFPETAMTAMLCLEPENVMEQEEAYREALHNTVAFQVSEGQLQLTSSSGELLLTFKRREEVALDPAALVETQWQLVSLNGEAPVAGFSYTLAFLDRQMVLGRAGCRSYVFGYRADGDSIVFPQQAMFGDEGCLETEAIREQEGLYTDSFSAATHYRLSENRLEILTARGETLQFEPLSEIGLKQNTWQLVALATLTEGGMWTEALRPSPDAGATAVFTGDRISGSAGCNGYSGSAVHAGDGLVIGELAREKKFCAEPEGVMEQEERYLTFLEDVAEAHVAGNLLWLETEDGRALLFSLTDASE